MNDEPLSWISGISLWIFHSPVAPPPFNKHSNCIPYPQFSCQNFLHRSPLGPIFTDYRHLVTKRGQHIHNSERLTWFQPQTVFNISRHAKYDRGNNRIALLFLSDSRESKWNARWNGSALIHQILCPTSAQTTFWMTGIKQRRWLHLCLFIRLVDGGGR